jgi:hypothetical protein
MLTRYLFLLVAPASLSPPQLLSPVFRGWGQVTSIIEGDPAWDIFVCWKGEASSYCPDPNSWHQEGIMQDNKAQPIPAHPLSMQSTLSITSRWPVRAVSSLTVSGEDQKAIDHCIWAWAFPASPNVLAFAKGPLQKMHTGSSCRKRWRNMELSFSPKHFCPSCANVLQLNTFQNDPPKNVATRSISDVCLHPIQRYNSHLGNIISCNRNC